jgi:transposase
VQRADARKLDHKTLEEIRIRAVERVRTGESPEVVIRALGFTRACIYHWLAMYRAGGWGELKAKAIRGRPKKISGEQMQWLSCTVVGKSAAAVSVRVRALDAGDTAGSFCESGVD